MTLAVTLRERASEEIAPPKPRSKQEESRRAFANQAKALANPHPSTAVYKFTEAPRGKPTPLALELSKSTTLKVTPKPPPAEAESLQTRRCRMAALVRWHPSHSTALVVAQPPAIRGEALKLVPADDEARHWRRGESKVNPGSYRQAPVDEIIHWVERMMAKEMKWTDMQRLYDDSKIRVSPGMINKIVYDKSGTKLAALKAKGFSPLGAPRQVCRSRSSARSALRSRIAFVRTGAHRGAGELWHGAADRDGAAPSAAQRGRVVPLGLRDCCSQRHAHSRRARHAQVVHLRQGPHPSRARHQH
jgi:hypothetical protein